MGNMKLAKKICYGRERHKAVTLKGTLISKNGNITGGSEGSGGFANKARLWDDREVQGMKDKRDKLIEELRNCENQMEGQSESDLRQAIDSKQHQLNLLQNAKISVEKLLKKKESEVKKVTKEIAKTEKKMKKTQGEVIKTKEEVTVLEKEVNSAKDEVYADFAKKVGVKSIAEFETKGLERVQEFEEKNQKLKSQINKVEQQLKLAKSKDFSRTIKNLEKAIGGLTKDKEKAAKAQEKRLDEIEKLKVEIEELEKENLTNQNSLKKAKVKTKKIRKEMNA